MDKLLKELATILQGIHAQTYLERNTSKEVTYPYATYNLDSEPLRRNQDGFYIDIDVFDRADTTAGVLLLEDQFKDVLLFRREMTEDLFLMFSFQGSNKVPTGDDQLKRRNIRFYVTVDWRKKEYGN